MNDFIYKVNDVEYPVHITHKKIKNIHYRFVDGAFQVSCHPWTSKRNVLVGLDKYAASLIKRSSKISPLTSDYIYIFGVKNKK